MLNATALPKAHAPRRNNTYDTVGYRFIYRLPHFHQESRQNSQRHCLFYRTPNYFGVYEEYRHILPKFMLRAKLNFIFPPDGRMLGPMHIITH